MSNGNYNQGDFPYGAATRALGMDANRPLFVQDEFEVGGSESVLVPGQGFRVPEAFWLAWAPAGALVAQQVYVDTVRQLGTALTAFPGEPPGVDVHRWAGMVRNIAPLLPSPASGYDFEIFTRVLVPIYPIYMGDQPDLGTVLPYAGFFLTHGAFTEDPLNDGPFIAAGLRMSGIDGEDNVLVEVHFSKWNDSQTLLEQQVYPWPAGLGVFLRIVGTWDPESEETAMTCFFSADGITWLQMGPSLFLEGDVVCQGVAAACANEGGGPFYAMSCAVDFIRGRVYNALGTEAGVLESPSCGIRNWP